MKKFVSTFLSIALALSVVGCGNASPSPSPSSAPSAPTKSSETPGASTQSGEPVTLTIWAHPQQADDRFNEELKTFMDKNPNIKVEVAINEAGDGSELMTAIASGTGPDLCSISYPIMDKYIYAGVLTDITDRLEKWDDYKNINKDMMDMFKTGGKYYGVPSQQYTMVLVYNKSLFKEAGLEPPKTWDEMLEVSRKLTDPSKQQYGFALNWAQWAEWWYMMFVWGAGGDLTKIGPNGELEPTFTDPAVIKAAEFYRQLKAEKLIQPDMTMQLDQLKQDFAMGKAAMILDGSDAAPAYVTKGMRPEDIGFSVIPAGPSGKGTMQVGGSLYTIPMNKDGAKVDAAFELLKFYMSKETMETKILTELENGIKSSVILGRTDIKTSDYFDEAEDVKETLEYASKNGKREFYGKGVVGSFVDKAVQEMMVNDTKNIEEIFKKYQDEALKKEIPDFNKSVLEKK